MGARPVAADVGRLVCERSLPAAHLGRLELCGAAVAVAAPHLVVEADAYLSVITEAAGTGVGAGAQDGIAESADSGRAQPETT